MTENDTQYDVVIIGGGPAGSAAAAILAEKGRRVVILEKETFPRYRIGESLIPYCWYPLNRLGVLDRMRDADFAVNKYSVQFVGLDGRASTPFYFFKHTDHDCAKTWQVLRSEFDRMLVENAVERGAVFCPATTARSLIEESGRVVGVEAVTPSGESRAYRSSVTIDASGRDMFTVSRKSWKVPDEKLTKIALWSYFRGGERGVGMDEGATIVAYLPEKGWFWYIPLPDDIVSVGVVAEREYLYRGPRDPEAILLREIETQPWIREHLAAAEKIRDCRVTGDFSYRSRYCAADGLVLTGDAFAFLDPVFSSGVFLALQGGVLAGDAVEAALAAGDVSAARFEDYGETFCRGLEAMRRLVYAFYDMQFSFGSFLKKHPDFRGDLTDCLIGDLQKDFDPMFEAVAEFAQIPGPLSHGRPRLGMTNDE